MDSPSERVAQAKEGKSLKIIPSTKNRKDLFGDCALVEIIHLHDCLRGALKALDHDVSQLSKSLKQGGRDSNVNDLERRVAGRFKVIWSVFRAHSTAEDEFIWPALQSKTGRHLGSPKYSPTEGNQACENKALKPSGIEQHEYAEDHADEERMFKSMDELLVKLRARLIGNSSSSGRMAKKKEDTVHDMACEILKLTSSLMQHLMEHLEKEETQCMPLVVEFLNKEEINDLVGQIMGKRSSETIAEIMRLAIENLEVTEREQMLKYMKQAMVGTFFEKWLAMSGWNIFSNEAARISKDEDQNERGDSSKAIKHVIEDSTEDAEEPRNKKAKIINPIKSPEDLEQLIRAIATNPKLTAVEKNTTIQGLRDSVWKSNKKIDNAVGTLITSDPRTPSSSCKSRSERESLPSAYYKKDQNGKVRLVWSRDEAQGKSTESSKCVPKFTAEELVPTYHNGIDGTVLGCPHYTRSCKLRHPSSGRLYTCRLCCEQERENPLKEQDSNLDRYAVTEVYCMRCRTLQPAAKSCLNPKCESQGAPFGKYYCDLCNLYDDAPNKNIFHCPFCNVCKIGKGLGIDYRHCMRCNACVSLTDDAHRCIPQRLQSSCPICHESMYESTEPLRGLKCGHAMHLSCFDMYMRGGNYTCPFCKKSVEDMKEYFSMLDAAVRMQPMPEVYRATVSNIDCQDCNKKSQVPYHFVGCKCHHCGSYNTRELGRVQNYQAENTMADNL
mmetsp:Transcript_26403/g.40019  ORF Transcript_26403/g.40019 Transcript_26403/m.40019 type:complete len:725 (+) Transcript_26403:147-2321(+)|eukprot:CAMPEP_0178904890 /NCGR_PEP_ID=MMETSP0786-20121207/5948_1 /TAXON_ID=186022 /ORGANISM="Thalassionema frauenfeldii, Strain CCMP 1798" /LENGTH=724 /DNA_ID=CAMNT_0020576391 /DNA_START=114 /DNA_END=2288 /DNA_ORIENTATION=+